MDPNYTARLQAGAKRIADCVNISITDLYFDDNMNSEMERLFGFPVYKEHKEISSSSTSSLISTSFNPNALNVIANNEQGMLQTPAYKCYATNLIQQELVKLSNFEEPKTANLLSNNIRNVVSPSYSKVLQKYKPPYERTLFANTSLNKESYMASCSQGFEKNSTYKSLRDSSPMFQPSLEETAVDEITDSVSRFNLNIPDTSYTFSKNMANKFALKKNCLCKFCYTTKANGKVCKNHGLQDEDGNVVHLKLRKLVCSNCGATGDAPHTYKYCPQNDFDLLDEDSAED